MLKFNQKDFPFTLLYSVINNTKILDKSIATGCVDLEGIVRIKASHPLAAPKIVIPEEPKGWHAHFKRS